ETMMGIDDVVALVPEEGRGDARNLDVEQRARQRGNGNVVLDLLADVAADTRRDLVLIDQRPASACKRHLRRFDGCTTLLDVRSFARRVVCLKNRQLNWYVKSAYE